MKAVIGACFGKPRRDKGCQQTAEARGGSKTDSLSQTSQGTDFADTLILDF